MYRYGFPYGNRSPVRAVQKVSLPNTEQAVSAQAEDPVSEAARTKAASVPANRPAVFSGGRLYLASPSGEGQSGENASPALLMQTDPAELAVRMRIQYLDPASAPPGASAASGSPGASGNSGELPGPSGKTEAVSENEAPGKIGEEEKCQTCERRKYQDGSNDMGVSFKTPTRVAPEAAASAVRGHEQEHVVRERAKAEREDRRVVSQNVTLHTGICPECGKVYISGGTTRTVTAAKSEPQTAEIPEKDGLGQAQAARSPFSAVA